MVVWRCFPSPEVRSLGHQINNSTNSELAYPAPGCCGWLGGCGGGACPSPLAKPPAPRLAGWAGGNAHRSLSTHQSPRRRGERGLGGVGGLGGEGEGVEVAPEEGEHRGDLRGMGDGSRPLSVVFVQSRGMKKSAWLDEAPASKEIYHRLCRPGGIPQTWYFYYIVKTL